MSGYWIYGVEMRIDEVIQTLPKDELTRIDVGLEGDWSGTVVTVWSRDIGLIGFDGVTKEHKEFKPSIELYYEDSWLGFHCYSRIDDMNVFDERAAMQAISLVESVLANDSL